MSEEEAVELEKTEELLHIYMDLCEEQAEAINKMSQVIKKQNEKIRHMENIHGFMDIKEG